jgi:hypothetical protein
VGKRFLQLVWVWDWISNLVDPVGALLLRHGVRRPAAQRLHDAVAGRVLLVPEDPDVPALYEDEDRNELAVDGAVGNALQDAASSARRRPRVPCRRGPEVHLPMTELFLDWRRRTVRHAGLFFFAGRLHFAAVREGIIAACRQAAREGRRG